MRGRPERHRAQIASAGKARDRAFRRLRDAHRKEYDRYYAEEAEQLGISPRSPKK